MITTPALIRYLITVTALFIVLTQVYHTSLAQKAMFAVLTLFCTEWLFYFIPYLKRGKK